MSLYRSEQERAFEINPVNPDSLAHNARVLTTLHALTSPLLGLCAGILGLESLFGFAFYFVGTLLVDSLVAVVLCRGRPGKYFVKPRDVWTRELLSGLWGFGLVWTGAFGGLRT